MSEAQQPQNQQPQQQQPATFQIEKVYVKDVSLEIPHAPKVFMEQAQPQLEVRIDTGAENFAEGYFEVTVSATVTARLGERTLFLVEVAQAGIFAVRNVASEELDPLLGIACPTVIFPYLRETISDLVVRAGFPPVLLAPLSFEALYMQRLQQQQAQEGNAAPGQGGTIQVAR
jgi:preprotein translocase subunit SecB